MVALANDKLLERFSDDIRETNNDSGAYHLYSVAALTNQAGAVVERYRYDAYGQRIVLAADGITTRTASNYDQQVAFTGRYLDSESGLYYYRARMYSASLGRFIGRDPLEYVDAYCLYSSTFIPNSVDPSGAKKIALAFKAFIPKSYGINIINNPIPSVNWGISPDPTNYYGNIKSMFATDDREALGSEGTSRARTFTIQDIEGSEIGNLESKGTLTQDRSDESHELLAKVGIKWTGFLSWEDTYTYINKTMTTKTSVPLRYHEKVKDISPCESHITVRVKGRYPFRDYLAGGEAPGIDYEVTWKLKRNQQNTKFEVASEGEVNEFPAYENLVNQTLIWGQRPTASGPGLFSLGVFTDGFDVPWRDIP